MSEQAVLLLLLQLAQGVLAIWLIYRASMRGYDAGFAHGFSAGTDLGYLQAHLDDATTRRVKVAEIFRRYD